MSVPPTPSSSLLSGAAGRPAAITLAAVSLAVSTIAGLTAVVSAPPAQAATDFCRSATATVYRTINPARGGNDLLTRSDGEARNASRYGFTDYRGAFGGATTAPAPGLTPVVRMYNPETVDFIWAAGDVDVAGARAVGYRVQQVDFYAPTTAASCTVAVHRMRKGDHRRDVWDISERAGLTSQGWVDGGVTFHVKDPGATAPVPTPTPTPAPPATDEVFGLAVMPDTQAETNNVSNTPFLNRVDWMVANKEKFDLRYVLHTGDMTNWGWLDRGQLIRARTAMDVLRTNGLPYALAIGNHDTRAVGWNGVLGSTGYGGSAYMHNPECPRRLGAANCSSRLLVRHTEEFNSTFPLSGMSGVGGAFEAGKADNYFTTFTADNTRWLVLTLELWPRTDAVAWARNVVATHPEHNVIIQTHHYLDRNGTVSASNGGYGRNSPKYLYSQIVSRYANVKLVFSGHTGTYASRTDTNKGNTVVSYLANDIGGPTYNPVRILQVNTATGRVTSTLVDPLHGGRVVSRTSHTIRIIH